MERLVLHTYFWHLEPDKRDRTVIRIYGITEQAENVCVIVTDFTPYAYLELPSGLEWSEQTARPIMKRIEAIMKGQKPIMMRFERKHKLYGAHFNQDGSRKLFPYLFCQFSTAKHRSALDFKLRGELHVNGIGVVRMRMHEQTATPILQLSTTMGLKKAGWMQIMGQRVAPDACITTCHHEFQVSWRNMVPYESNKPAPVKTMAFDIEAFSSNSARMPNPDVHEDAAFQISCIFRREGEKPDKWKQYLLTLGEPDPDRMNEDVTVYCYGNEGDLLIGWTELVQDENPHLIAGYNIFGFDINFMWKRAIMHMVINRFSVLGFVDGRQCQLENLDGLASKMKGSRGDLVHIYAEGRIFVDLYPIIMGQAKLNSYTLNAVSQHYLGDRFQKDPLDHFGIFKCYRVGMRKDENGEHTAKARRAIALCGNYCVKDTALVVMLMDQMRTWYGLVEMANLCNIPVFEVFTEGQQLRIYSQLYAECMKRNFVVEREGYIPQPGERYRGAFVVDPDPGYYEEVACLDFKSLYPSIMIAHNLCYTTMVMETPVPDEQCNVFSWSDHQLCSHDPKIIELDQLKDEIGAIVDKQRKIRTQRDALRVSDFDDGFTDKRYAKKAYEAAVAELNAEIHKLDLTAKPLRVRKEAVNVTPKDRSKKQMCAKRDYKFVKPEKAKGIIPELLQTILDTRAATRKEIKVVAKKVGGMEEGDEKEDLVQYMDILDARQLAYKICANSVYGGFGVNDASSRKFVPLMPVAMTVTYLGREHIQLSARVSVNQYGAKLVYGDTDSIMVSFPECKTPQEVWDRSDYVAARLTELYPEPLELEFENVYARFLIFSKKRYTYLIADRDGNLKSKLGSKGILMARRDNSAFVRTVYGDSLMRFMQHEPRDEILYYIVSQIKRLLSRGFGYDSFVVTMSVQSTGGLNVTTSVEDDGTVKGKVGNYKLRTLLGNDKEEAMAKKGCKTEEEYYVKQLPRQAQLAERMRRRGCPVDAGARLQFVVTDRPECKTQGEKIEEFDYFQAHADVLRLDLLYYLEALVTPLDEALDAMYGKDPTFHRGMVAECLRRAKLHKKLMGEMEKYWRPRLVRPAKTKKTKASK
jgi:DNA polymerase elongation subunit (family B)